MEAQETGGNPGEAAGGMAAPAPGAGSSFLTNDAFNVEVPPPPPGSADAYARDAIEDGARPEWVPEKFWDKTTGKPRVEELGKGYQNLEKLVGRDKIVMPTGDDDDEGWERVNAAFRPENEDKYDFGEPPKLPDDLPYDSELEKSFRNAAWQNGIHQRAAKNLYEQFVKVQMERHAQWSRAQQERKAELINDLQREAGAKYPVYVKRASSTIERYADPDFKQYLDETGLGNDPRMIRFMARVGEDMAGETRLEGKPQQQGKPQDIEQAIRKFEEDNKTALWDSTHPNHRALVAERSRLYEMRYGTDVVAGG